LRKLTRKVNIWNDYFLTKEKQYCENEVICRGETAAWGTAEPGINIGNPKVWTKNQKEKILSVNSPKDG